MKPNFLFVDVFPGKLGAVFDELAKHRELSDNSIVLGEHDILCKANVDALDDQYRLLGEICSIPDVRRAGIYTSLRHRSNGVNPEAYRYKAWVLINAREPEMVLEKILDIDGMVEASAIAGEWSILAYMCGNSFEDIGRGVVNIQSIGGVLRTETLAAFPKELVAELRKTMVAPTA